MRFLVFVLMGLVFSILESSLFSFFPMEFFKPDLGLPLVIYGALFFEPLVGLSYAVVIGVTQEVFSSAPHGTILFTKVTVFLLSTLFLKRELSINSRHGFAIICSIFVVIESVVYLMLLYFGKGSSANLINVAFYLVPNAVFTGFASMYMLSLIDLLKEKVYDRR